MNTKQREAMDKAALSDAFFGLSSVVMDGDGLRERVREHADETQTAAGHILSYYKKPMPQDDVASEDTLGRYFAPHGIMRRGVRLTGAWYKDAIGPMLAETVDGHLVALLPKRGHYEMIGANGTTQINRKTAAQLRPEALCFYLPLPTGVLSVKDLLSYLLKTLGKAGYAVVLIASLFAVLIGMIAPQMTQLIFRGVIPSGNLGFVLPVALMLLFSYVAVALIEAVRSLTISMAQGRAGIALQAAAMSRVLNLPTRFFREYSAGDVATRLKTLSQLGNQTLGVLLSTGLTGIFSLLYVRQIAGFAPALVIPAVLITLVQAALSIVCVLQGIKLSRVRLQKESKLSGLTLTLFSGTQKIRLAGAENRMFAKWANAYRPIAALNYAPPMILRLQGAISTLIGTLGMTAIYFYASSMRVSVADFMAFSAAYGMMSGGFMALVGAAKTIAEFQPMVEMIAPVLETAPEIEPSKPSPGHVSGAIELSNVSFRYEPDAPLILNDLSLKVNPGEYVAIVGKTGSGKSTIVRLLLGFEKPQSGTISFDGKDLSKINVHAVRRQMGTVLQNGQLFQGSLYENIAVSTPGLSEEDAWLAAEKACLAEDIRHMPMGMRTVLGQEGGGISGGQKQRLLIARAIAGNPKMLLLDEATSALDNLTQAHVTKALDAMACTRIVIAHRLSTIRACDRIIYLEDGKIREDGSYDQLMANQGGFAQLVANQDLKDDKKQGGGLS